MIGLSTTQDVRRGAPLESVGRSVSMFGFVCVCVCVCLCVCVSVSSGGSALFNLLVPCACPRRAGSCPRRAGRGSRSRSVRAAGKLPGSVRAGGRKGDTARAQREPED